MAEIKWIKVVANMFGNRKIKQIIKMPDGDAIVVIWLQLLCLSGQVNESGFIYFSSEVPYTDEMLAVEFDRPINTIRMALGIFERFGMIEIIDNILRVSNWSKYQSAGKLEEIKNQNKLRKQKQRENQKLALETHDMSRDSHATCHTTVTQCHATDIDIDKEKDIYSTERLQASVQEHIKEDPVISLILNDKSEFGVLKIDIEEWQKLYPAVDIMQELRNMKGWLDSNPNKRKTAKGIRRFINNWLARKQDTGGNKTQESQKTSKYEKL